MKFSKIVLRIIIIVIVIVTVLISIGWLFDFSDSDPVIGFTFSDYYAEHELGLDAQETLRAILDDLEPRAIRLVAYWNRIEKTRSSFDFSSLDAQIAQAEPRGIPVTLAIGYRTPRWPECHIPEWAADLPREEFKAALFAYFDAVIERYINRSVVRTWQVENEPLLGTFGRCPVPDREFLKEEIAHVRERDLSRLILTTASGELSLWTHTAGLTDVFGTTLYRHIWNKYAGNFTHVFPPSWYALRAWFAKRFLGAKDIIISELQAEPWGEGKPLPQMAFDEQTRAFTADNLLNIVMFAKRTGIREIYLWGPEWWYYRKLNSDPSFWDAGKTIFISE